VLGIDPNTVPGYRKTRAIDVEPRFGFAWDVFGSGKSVIRFQGGMYHAPRVGGGTTGGNLVNNQPANRAFSIDFGNINNLAALTGTAITRPSTINAVEQDSHTPSIYNFTFGIQQDIGFETVMEVSYVGSFARHLGQRININGVPDGARLGTNNIDPVTGQRFGNDFLRPYRGYADINVVTWGGTSNYNSLQMQISRRYTQGFQYGVAYTYSKSFDYANDDSSDVFFGRPYKDFNYAPSDFDQTHILTFNYIYDVPGLGRKVDNRLVKAIFDNWQLTGTTSYASGKPKNISVTYQGGTTDITGGQINARANTICDPMRNISGADPTGTPYVVNVNCFARPTRLGDIGNTPRNSLRMPSIFNNDVALFKNIPFGESRSLQLRWEVYNVFNHTNFRDIDAGLVFDATGKQTNTRFGAPILARTPRVMQAAIKFTF
jgi:hypothetical protein